MRRFGKFPLSAPFGVAVAGGERAEVLMRKPSLVMFSFFALALWLVSGAFVAAVGAMLFGGACFLPRECTSFGIVSFSTLSREKLAAVLVLLLPMPRMLVLTLVMIRLGLPNLRMLLMLVVVVVLATTAMMIQG